MCIHSKNADAGAQAYVDEKNEPVFETIVAARGRGREKD